MAALPLGSVCSDQDVPHVRLVPARPGWTHRQHGQAARRSVWSPRTGWTFDGHRLPRPPSVDPRARRVDPATGRGHAVERGRSPRAGGTGRTGAGAVQQRGVSPHARGYTPLLSRLLPRSASDAFNTRGVSVHEVDSPRRPPSETVRISPRQHDGRGVRCGNHGSCGRSPISLTVYLDDGIFVVQSNVQLAFRLDWTSPENSNCARTAFGQLQGHRRHPLAETVRSGTNLVTVVLACIGAPATVVTCVQADTQRPDAPGNPVRFKHRP